MERNRERVWFEHRTDVAIPIGDVTIVKFWDKKIHDGPQIQQIEEELDGLIAQGKKKVLFDFTGVEYTNEWFGVLIKFRKKLIATGGRMAMCNMQENVLETFRRMKLGETFSISLDEETAFLNLAKKPNPNPSPDEQLRMQCAQWLGVPTEKVSIAMAKVWAQEQHK